MANVITTIRILCSVALLFCAVLSPWFFVLYLIAGVSDMVDGWVARKTNTVSDFGSKLDTFADILFVVVCLVKLLPVLHLPVWIYVWVGIIAGMKVFNIVYSYVVRKQFITDHSILNKLTGALLFLLPLTLSVIDVKYSAAAVCLVATVAAVKEGTRENETLVQRSRVLCTKQKKNTFFDFSENHILCIFITMYMVWESPFWTSDSVYVRTMKFLSRVSIK